VLRGFDLLDKCLEVHLVRAFDDLVALDAQEG